MILRKMRSGCAESEVYSRLYVEKMATYHAILNFGREVDSLKIQIEDFGSMPEVVESLSRRMYSLMAHCARLSTRLETKERRMNKVVSDKYDN